MMNLYRGCQHQCINDDLGKKLEPGAALVSERLAVMRFLAERGIKVGVL